MRSLFLVFLGGWSSSYASSNMDLARSLMEKSVQSVVLQGEQKQGELGPQTFAELLEEIKKSPITPVKDRDHFDHLSRKTWIETDIQRFGEIRYVQGPEFSSKTIDDLIKFLAHEYSHHLLTDSFRVGEEERHEREVAELAEQLSARIFDEIPFPELLQIKNGNFFRGSEGCHDKLAVKDLDPSTGKMKLILTTSRGHCRTIEEYTSFWFRKFGIDRPGKHLYVFDIISLEIQCTRNEGKLSCLSMRPKDTNFLCPDYLKDLKDKNTDDFNSGISFGPKVIQAHLNWCVQENPMAAFFQSEKNTYWLNPRR